MRPRTLAAPLTVASSTLSAAIRRLTDLGYISSDPSQSDLRQRELRLTTRGAEAMAGTSVLDAGKVAAVLKLLDAESARPPSTASDSWLPRPGGWRRDDEVGSSYCWRN